MFLYNFYFRNNRCPEILQKGEERAPMLCHVRMTQSSKYFGSSWPEAEGRTRGRCLI